MLRFEALGKAKQRPSVHTKTFQIFPIDPFGVASASRFQEQCTQHLPRWLVPDWRFVVRNAVFNRHGLLEKMNGFARMPLSSGQFSGHNARRDLEVREQRQV